MKKRKYILLLLLFVLFIIEGTVIPWLVPDEWQTRVVPHLAYIVILFVSVYYNRHVALILGLVFGMLQDVVYYGSLIGAYSFTMGLCGYLSGLVVRTRRAPLPLMMIVVIMGSLLLDSALFGAYSLFELTHEPFSWALTNHIIPNAFIHFVFGLAIYVPLRKQLELIAKRYSSDDHS